MRSWPPVPDPTRLRGRPLHKQTGLAGGGWKLGHRPEEFRSLGRLSASELCSLPMVPAAVAAEERRRGDRAETGTGKGMLHGSGRRSGAAVCGWCTQPTQGGRAVAGWGGPIWGTAWLLAIRPSSLGETQGEEAGKPGISRACDRRAAPFSLTCSCAASWLLPGNGLVGPAARDRQFRVRGPPPLARGWAGRFAPATRPTPP